MAVIKFNGTYPVGTGERLSVGIAPEYVDRVAKGVEALRKSKERLNLEAIDVTVTVEYHLRKRTLDQNALLWWTYSTEANIQNAGRIGKSAITAEALYAEDVKENGYSVVLDVVPEAVDVLSRHFKYVTPIGAIYRDGLRFSRCVCIYGSSKWDVRQMSAWLEKRFERLAELGNLNSTAEIAYYWQEYRNWQGKNGIRPDYENILMSPGEYKAKVKLCEATGTWLGFSGLGGSLAHIKARGMGRNPMETEGYGRDWMHLCDSAHALWDNGRGRVAFLRKYPHLRYKIESALKKEIGQ